MHVSLIVSGPLTTVSGAYEYNRRMAEGLRTLGHTVQVIELEGRSPDPDQAAIYAARTAWAVLPEGSLPLIDGLALPAFDGVPLSRVTALVHHPASLETGLLEETRRRLLTTEAAMFRAVSRLVTTSDPTADRLLRAYGAPDDRISVVIPGTDDLPRSPGSSGPACEILSVGALIPRKGHDVLLRALSRLYDLDWRLTIVGTAARDPVHANGLHALAEKLHIDRRVQFIEEMTEEQWRDADVFALASYFEGYGVAVAEALRRGLPVAVTNVGAVPTLVPPEAGVVGAPGDIEQLSKAMRRLIFDRGLRRDMGEVAWQSGQALPSWDVQVKQLADVLASDR
jgi:glycosyltransferase involved in cell wall biosynthesis